MLSCFFHNVSSSDPLTNSQHGLTALMIASDEGYLSIVELLVKNGAYLDIQDKVRTIYLNHKITRYKLFNFIVWFHGFRRKRLL
jgi:ankyrin repeat protein